MEFLWLLLFFFFFLGWSPEKLYWFTFSPALAESACFTAPSLTLGIIYLLEPYWFNWNISGIVYRPYFIFTTILWRVHLVASCPWLGKQGFQRLNSYPSQYRYTSFYCGSQILCFWQIEGLWQPCVEQGYRHHFPKSICSLCFSVSHFGNSCNISKIFISIIFVMVIFDATIAKRLWLIEGSDDSTF